MLPVVDQRLTLTHADTNLKRVKMSIINQSHGCDSTCYVDVFEHVVLFIGMFPWNFLVWYPLTPSRLHWAHQTMRCWMSSWDPRRPKLLGASNMSVVDWGAPYWFSNQQELQEQSSVYTYPIIIQLCNEQTFQLGTSISQRSCLAVGCGEYLPAKTKKHHETKDPSLTPLILITKRNNIIKHRNWSSTLQQNRISCLSGKIAFSESCVRNVTKARGEVQVCICLCCGNKQVKKHNIYK